MQAAVAAHHLDGDAVVGPPSVNAGVQRQYPAERSPRAPPLGAVAVVLPDVHEVLTGGAAEHLEAAVGVLRRGNAAAQRPAEADRRAERPVGVLPHVPQPARLLVGAVAGTDPEDLLL